jgi:hypothetical protein
MLNDFQYLGIPLLAGIITRFSVMFLTSKEFFNRRFLPIFSPLSLIRAPLHYHCPLCLPRPPHHPKHRTSLSSIRSPDSLLHNYVVFDFLLDLLAIS